jgi:hypothetical protein
MLRVWNITLARHKNVWSATFTVVNKMHSGRGGHGESFYESKQEGSISESQQGEYRNQKNA